MSSTTKPECFIIMPISDPDGYAKDHFKRVHEDIFGPACEAAGFTPFRADGVKETNLIHLDILQRLLGSPMALCDLSSRNPNVLFELGIRQAFDKPVVLVQELGTPRIFDIAPLRVIDYRPARIYHEVREDQQTIATALTSTVKAAEKGDGINSIVRLLALTAPAALPDVSDTHRDPVFQLIRAEMAELRHEIRRNRRDASHTARNVEHHPTRQLPRGMVLDVASGMRRIAPVSTNLVPKFRHFGADQLEHWIPVRVANVR